jgi:hypothetical protein
MDYTLNNAISEESVIAVSDEQLAKAFSRGSVQADGKIF